MDQGSLFEKENKPVECLGMTFKNDDERREYFRNELRKKLPDLRSIEGFPIGEDEDIIELSDPPYYTACPNPWMNEFVSNNKQIDEAYTELKPYTADVSEGKNEPIYNVHTYHTKVPPKAIMRYLLHYTMPGDFIFDGFSGSGMTGVASSYLNIESKVRELGYDLKDKRVIDSSGVVVGNMGERKVLLQDLSTQATFISSCLNKPIDIEPFLKEANTILNSLEEKYKNFFITHREEGEFKVNYWVWSDVFVCSSCSEEIVFFDAASDDDGKVQKEFACPNCKARLTKNKLDRAFEKKYEPTLDKIVNEAKRVIVLVNYTNYSGKKILERVTNQDIELFKKIDSEEIINWLPTNEIPNGDEIPRVRRLGITNVNQLYFKKSQIILSDFREKINNSNNKDFLLLLFTSQLINISKLNRFRPGVSFPYNPMSGTMYIGSLVSESNVIEAYRNKLKKFEKAFIIKNRNTMISTQSSTKINLNDNSIDYIFTDPPFGANLMYSELSFMWETWIKLQTNTDKETIISKKQNKGVDEYLRLLTATFSEYYRILKPNKWITVEFSNSKASVWNAIQDAMQKSGFIIANVSALDKQQGSFKAVTTTTAVKQDLVISAYKPLESNISKIKEANGSEISAWLFIDQHLLKLPVFDGERGEATVITERTPRILFDRMIAYHVQSGMAVPISSADFQEKVAQKYVMRDGMVFLESQVAEYDKKRILAKEFSQQSLFVSDEGSAIEWLRQQLMKKPQSRQDIHPQFMKEIQYIAKHEELPELDNLLVENFLLYDSEDVVPDQIAAYLRKNYHDMRGLENQDDKLKSKAKNRWYVPDPNKQADLEKLREKSLLREFNHYVEEVSGTKKKLKLFRSEAIRAGFKQAWSEKDYQKIVDVAEYLPEKIIQEDDKLLMFHTHALMRLDI
ncbi:DNA methylase [Enterococcus faecalis]|nr:DNA methyltransferase [Enterococcus faecalis]EGO2849126.1 DNA methylase [Enterococcus faecalis]EGO6134498.1 DNA methylase [Enterococcus faecalis]EGO6644555.1 DNA methylase [Enterococcus faecalis]EGO7833827.1 DNA methylase [Enterococcus faecalis]EIR9756349.1 DNA methylase [Enterococcus faecalis]